MMTAQEVDWLDDIMFRLTDREPTEGHPAHEIIDSWPAALVEQGIARAREIRLAQLTIGSRVDFIACQLRHQQLTESVADEHLLIDARESELRARLDAADGVERTNLQWAIDGLDVRRKSLDAEVASSRLQLDQMIDAAHRLRTYLLPPGVDEAADEIEQRIASLNDRINAMHSQMQGLTGEAMYSHANELAHLINTRNHLAEDADALRSRYID